VHKPLAKDRAGDVGAQEQEPLPAICPFRASASASASATKLSGHKST
jgi:hypothetical protein